MMVKANSVVFGHPPRTGGRSVRRAFNGVYHAPIFCDVPQHEPAWKQFAMLGDEASYSFGLVRNPYSRFLSIAAHFVYLDRNVHELTPFHFHRWMDNKMEEDLARRPAAMSLPIDAPCWDFLSTEDGDEIVVEDVFRFEDGLDKCIRDVADALDITALEDMEVPEIRTGAQVLQSEDAFYVDSAKKEFVEKRYAKDFDAWY